MRRIKRLCFFIAKTGGSHDSLAEGVFHSY